MAVRPRHRPRGSRFAGGSARGLLRHVIGRRRPRRRARPWVLIPRAHHLAARRSDVDGFPLRRRRVAINNFPFALWATTGDHDRHELTGTAEGQA